MPTRTKKGAEQERLEIPAEMAGFNLAEEKHCRPVTPTSQAERGSARCGLPLDFLFPNQIREFKLRLLARTGDGRLYRRRNLQAFQQFARARQHAILAEQLDILARHVI